jgi:hypothetical protein
MKICLFSIEGHRNKTKGPKNCTKLRFFYVVAVEGINSRSPHVDVVLLKLLHFSQQTQAACYLPFLLLNIQFLSVAGSHLVPVFASKQSRLTIKKKKNIYIRGKSRVLRILAKIVCIYCIYSQVIKL